MKQYSPQDIRNVALIGHGGAGKTSLAEALLHRAKATPRLGSVSDGSSNLDYLPEEHKRQASVSLALAQFEYGGKKINLIDTPGFADFEGELVAGMHAAGTVAVIVSADSGVGVGAELAWRRARALKLPAMIVITGMDKENADGMAALQSVRDKLSPKAVAMQIPMGNGPGFSGVVDVLRSQSFSFTDQGATKAEVPDEHRQAMEDAHAHLMESAAESSEELLNRYFDAGELTQDELVQGIHKGIAQGDLYPVLFCSALQEHGLTQVLDGITDLMPSPAERPAARNEAGDERPADPTGPLAARVFKTASETHVGEIYYVRVYSGTLKAGSAVFNGTRDDGEKMSQIFHAVGKNRTETESVSAGDMGIAVKLRNSGTNDTLCDKGKPISLLPIDFPSSVIDFAVRTVKSGEEDKMGTGLGRLTQEDPTLHFRHDEETHETIVSGMGETHLDMMVARLRERFNVEVELSTPRVAFRETIRGKSEVHARHKKQTGGRGQFADCHMRVEALPEGSGFEFASEVVGGSIPARFIPAIEKGIRESMGNGAIAGYPMVDFKCTVFDGAFHNVDSSEAAFKIAGSMAFKEGAQQAKPTMLEPYLDVKIVVPKDYMGDVMGDISSRRGRVQGMETAGDDQVINAQVPAAEMQRYAMDLRSLTQGRGHFERRFSHYEELPRDQQEKVIAESKAAEEVAK
ncbi:MAG TPA: elongation factor G [bacterium]|nr:elongation factor G [bacterium]